MISVDTKKKELIGNFKNGGREWQPQGEPDLVDVHDFPSGAIAVIDRSHGSSCGGTAWQPESACLGFGVDAYHGVSHAHVLENVAALERDGGYHGAFSVSRSTDEGALYLRAVEHAAELHHEHSSIVNGSIAAAIDGKFGNVPLSHRTKSELFINPLMGIYFTFDLMDLCKRNQYLRALVDTPSVIHVQAVIDDHHANVPHRPPRLIPH